MPLENIAFVTGADRQGEGRGRKGERMTLYLEWTKFLKYHKTERALVWSVSRLMKSKAGQHQEKQL